MTGEEIWQFCRKHIGGSGTAVFDTVSRRMAQLSDALREERGRAESFRSLLESSTDLLVARDAEIARITGELRFADDIIAAKNAEIERLKTALREIVENGNGVPVDTEAAMHHAQAVEIARLALVPPTEKP
jgi:chromosome segregation ATPase